MALLAAGCTFSALEIELPELSDGRATAVALEVGAEGRLSRVEFVSLFDRSNIDPNVRLPFDREFGLDADARVTLIEYGNGLGLADLGYPSGKIDRAPPGLDPARTSSLTAFPATIRELPVTQGEIGGWRARVGSELDGPLREFQFQDLQPRCACLSGKISETLSSTSSTVFLAQIGSRRVIVGTEDGRLYKVAPETPEGLVDVTPPEAQLPFRFGEGRRGITIGGGIGIGEGVMVVTDYDGRFWRYEFDAFDRVQTITRVGTWWRRGLEDNRQRVRWMAYAPPFIFGLDLGGGFGFVNLTTGEAERVHEFEYQPFYQHGGVAYSSVRDEIVVASVLSDRLGRYRDGRFSLDPPVKPLESLSAAVYHERMGWILGTPLSGDVHREVSPGDWESCTSPLGNSIGAIVPFRDGFIAGSTQGFIGQYSDADGWCEKLQPASNSIRFMVPYDLEGESFVVIGPNIEERRQVYSTVTFLTAASQEDCDKIRNPGKEPPSICRFSSPP